MRGAPFSKELQGGDRRSIGNSNRIAAEVLRRPRRFAELIECLWVDDPIVRMRAADAAEKVSVRRPELFYSYKKELLGLADEATQAELRWHLALMIPRLRLDGAEREWARSTLRRYLRDDSSIVKTCALQGMAELAVGDANAEAAMVTLLKRGSRMGTPAMRARSRKLLGRFQTK